MIPGILVLLRIALFVYIFVRAWRYFQTLFQKEEYQEILPTGKAGLALLIFFLASVLSGVAVLLFGLIIVIFVFLAQTILG